MRTLNNDKQLKRGSTSGACAVMFILKRILTRILSLSAHLSLPSPYTVSSWIPVVDWRLPVCNTLLFLSEMALQRFPDKTAT